MFNVNNFISNDSFLGTNANVTTVKDFDYNSFYRAYVVSIDDPDNMGRIKVRIPSLHGSATEMSLSSLPYAYPACFTGLGNQVGQFMLPPVNSIVFVTFEYSDEHRVIYFGGVPTLPYDGKEQYYGPHINDGEPKKITKADVPSEYTGTQAIVYKSPSGAIIMIDDNDDIKTVTIKDSTGKMFRLISATDYTTGITEDLIETVYNDDNYMQLKDNQLKIVLGGKEVTFNKDSLPGSGSGGTSDYQDLTNKPQINGVTLLGNKTTEQLGLQTTIDFATNDDIDKVISL